MSGYYGLPVDPDEVELDFKGWPRTGGFRDDHPTDRQIDFVMSLVERNHMFWRLDPYSMPKGVASALIAWLFHTDEHNKLVKVDWGKAPDWAGVVLGSEDEPNA